MGKNIKKNLEKCLGKSATNALKTSSKRIIKKKAESTGDFADKITKVSKKLQQNNLVLFTNGHDKEKPKERCISPEERQKMIVDLRLI